MPLPSKRMLIKTMWRLPGAGSPCRGSSLDKSRRHGGLWNRRLLLPKGQTMRSYLAWLRRQQRSLSPPRPRRQRRRRMTGRKSDDGLRACSGIGLLLLWESVRVDRQETLRISTRSGVMFCARFCSDVSPLLLTGLASRPVGPACRAGLAGSAPRSPARQAGPTGCGTCYMQFSSPPPTPLPLAKRGAIMEHGRKGTGTLFDP